MNYSYLTGVEVTPQALDIIYDRAIILEIYCSLLIVFELFTLFLNFLYRFIMNYSYVTGVERTPQALSYIKYDRAILKINNVTWSQYVSYLHCF